jgi:hypothetical protein
VTEKPNKKTQWINIKSLDIPDNTPVKVWLKDMDFTVLVSKQIRFGDPIQKRKWQNYGRTISGK